MSLIQHVNPDVQSLSYGDEEYKVGEEGVFDVPPEVAAELTKFPDWRVYDGMAWPHPKTPEEVDAERVAALVEKALEAKGEASSTTSKRSRKKE